MIVNHSSKGVTLFFAIVASLSAGTNYAYSAYAPQLATRLNLNGVQSNLVGACGNAGVYLTGPLVGRVVDAHGPRKPLLFSAAVLFVGYEIIRYIYDGGVDGPFRIFGVFGLAVGQFLTGSGSSSALSAAANGVAKSFGQKRRASAMSMVTAGFGLSAFFYSTIAHASFLSTADPTSAFLLVLSLGTLTSMLLGSIFVRYVNPETDSLGYQSLSTPPHHVEEHRDDYGLPAPEGASDYDDVPTNDTARESKIVSGSDLLKQTDFWILFAILGLLSGTGLCFINNIGLVTVTLSGLDSLPAEVARKQASLVSLLSVANCLGRLLSGFTSDHFLHHAPPHLRCGRAWWLVPIASLFFLSQLLASSTYYVEGLTGLALPTMLTGAAYGAMFGLTPVLILEWFSIERFSTNNGLLMVAPALGGPITNYVFGTIYDSHVLHSPTALLATTSFDKLAKRAASVMAADKLCTLGRDCYAGAFHLTAFMSLCAVGLAVVVGIRRGKL